MSKRALVVTRDFPWPQTEGAMQYTVQLLRVIEPHYEVVDVLCPEPKPELSVEFSNESPKLDFHFYLVSPPSTVKQLFSTWPAGCVRNSSGDGHATLQHLLSKHPQLVVIDHHHSAWSTPAIEQWKFRHPGARIVYVTHNEEFSTRLSIVTSEILKPHRSAAHLLDAIRSYILDRRVTEMADIVTCISSGDGERYRKLYGKNIVVFLPSYRGNVIVSRTITNETDRRICIVGSFVWAAKQRNLESFLSTGYKMFRSNNIQISIVGKIPSDYRYKLEKRWNGVEITGTVDDVEPYLAHSRIGVIPEQAGGGFKLKSLDYVFNRVPIYALRYAIVDLPLEHGVSAAMYENMNDLCKGIVRDIDDFDLLNRCQQQAFEVCSSFLDTDHGAKVFTEILRR